MHFVFWLFASHYFLSTFAGLFLPPKLVFFHFHAFFWCACVIVCVGTPVGTSVHMHGMHAVVRWQSWVWVLRHSPPLTWDGASQWPGTSPHGPGLLTAGCGNFPVSSPSYSSVFTGMCSQPYVCLLGGCRRSELGSSHLWGKNFIGCSVSSASYHSR